MEPVEWVSFVLIMFKVVFLGAFGVGETANLYFSDSVIWISLIMKHESYWFWNRYFSVTMTNEHWAIGMGVFCFNNVQCFCLGCICCVWHSHFVFGFSSSNKIYLSTSLHVFVPIAKCICQNCKRFKVVLLAAFGVVDTANLSPLFLIQQNALFLLKLNNNFAPTNDLLQQIFVLKLTQI